MTRRHPRSLSPAQTRPLSPKALLRPYPPGVDELNEAVTFLHEVLPHIDIRDVRKRLAQNAGVVHIADLTANILLDDGVRAHKNAGPAAAIALDARHMFRTDEYRNAVERILVTEFAGLSKATIQAVLAENSFSYSHSRDTLLTVSGKSWRFAISTWWNRRKPVSALPPPRSATGSVELNREIYGLHAPSRDAEVAADLQLASELNQEEHSAANALIECGCCFSDVVWEETAACAAGHLFCRDCLVRSAQDSASGGLRCISASAAKECGAPVPRAMLEAALPVSVLRRLDERCARLDIAQSGLRLVCCPFCPYAAADDVPHYHVRLQTLMILWAVLFVALRFLSPWMALAFLVLTGLQTVDLSPIRIERGILHVLELVGAEAGACALSAKRRGTRFVCRNADCRLGSCVLCGKEWPSTASHNCAEDERQKLRLHIELNMAEAVKRTCPKCRCAFVKDGGCNKMACPCGYKMCYLCRANLSDEGYHHFCQHFRPLGGPCRQCLRCDLYGDPDDDAIARAAGLQAEKAYIAAHGDPRRRGATTMRNIPLAPVPPDGDSVATLWDLVLYLDLD